MTNLSLHIPLPDPQKKTLLGLITMDVAWYSMSISTQEKSYTSIVYHHLRFGVYTLLSFWGLLSATYDNIKIKTRTRTHPKIPHSRKSRHLQFPQLVTGGHYVLRQGKAVQKHAELLWRWQLAAIQFFFWANRLQLIHANPTHRPHELQKILRIHRVFWFRTQSFQGLGF